MWLAWLCRSLCSVMPHSFRKAETTCVRLRGCSISDYGSLQKAVRARVDEMGLTRLELDHLSGNQEGYSGKLLGPEQVKKFGKYSLGSTLGALGSYLALVADPEQAAKLKAIADALSALSAAVGLGVTLEEFMRIAAIRTLPHKHGIGFLGDTLSSAGCKLVLVEDASATAKMMARANKRQRPLRPAKRMCGAG
jgi:hypothetical protein